MGGAARLAALGRSGTADRATRDPRAARRADPPSQICYIDA